MNFANLTGFSDDYGVVTQIADAAGNVLWAVSGDSDTVILEVEKFTSNTYAGETLYENEQFVLLDIYPKTNGTVNVTYGGLTKTITDTSGAAEPNAQQVFFGTFNGVSDSVTTPASGTLTIEGDYRGFGIGEFGNSKLMTGMCRCITKVSDMGVVEFVPPYAFGSAVGGSCDKITSITIPSSVTSIGSNAFVYCTGLTNVIISSSVTSIGGHAFASCTGLTNVTIPSSVTSIGGYAFALCTGLTNVTFDNASGWYVTETEGATSGTAVDVTDVTNNVTLITDTYDSYYWYRS